MSDHSVCSRAHPPSTPRECVNAPRGGVSCARERPTYLIELRAEDHPVPSIIRLRKALKLMLRVLGLKVVSVRETAVTTTTNTQTGATPQENP